jgi:hypothetical protein
MDFKMDLNEINLMAIKMAIAKKIKGTTRMHKDSKSIS